MTSNHQLTLTSDGSHTLYVPEIDEHYHSVNGAVQESRHIFIDAGLHECKKNEINVFEVGFGTGLNAFLVMLEAERLQKKIYFTTVELYPVDLQNIKKLNYPDQISVGKTEDFRKLHSAEWNKKIEISPYFYLKKICGDFTKLTLESNFDVVFFDAFSPEKQAEMWTENIFATIYEKCNENAVLTTYCAKGAVRRAMQKAGFTVERIPGPPGKREILRSRKIIINC